MSKELSIAQPNKHFEVVYKTLLGKTRSHVIYGNERFTAAKAHQYHEYLYPRLEIVAVMAITPAEARAHTDLQDVVL